MVGAIPELIMADPETEGRGRQGALQGEAQAGRVYQRDALAKAGVVPPRWLRSVASDTRPGPCPVSGWWADRSQSWPTSAPSRSPTAAIPAIDGCAGW